MLVSRRLLKKGQYFTTLDDTEFDRLRGSCREYALPRSDQSSQVKGWIGPVLDVMVCYHQGCYGVESMVESPVGDKTCSWVKIMNGINKYVTEMSEETHVESIGEKSTRKLVAKARPQPRCHLCLFRTVERKWIDVEPGTFDRNCLEVSKLMIRLLRHDDAVHREEDGAVRFEDLASIFRSRNASTSHWSIWTWPSLLAKRRSSKRKDFSTA